MFIKVLLYIIGFSIAPWLTGIILFLHIVIGSVMSMANSAKEIKDSVKDIHNAFK